MKKCNSEPNSCIENKMKRSLFNDLAAWKISENRKPLILQGARQVGKTWLMKEFGRQEFKQIAYINFESSSRLKHLFAADFNMERILAAIEIEKTTRWSATSAYHYSRKCS